MGLLLVQETGRYFRGFEDNFRFQDAIGDAITFMSAIETRSNGLACPDPFSSTDSDFETAFRAFLPEETEDPDSAYELARKVIDTEVEIEMFKAAPVADDGANAVKGFAEACPEVPAETIDVRHYYVTSHNVQKLHPFTNTNLMYFSTSQRSECQHVYAVCADVGISVCGISR